MHILIIDSDKTTVRLLTQELELLGHAVHIADSALKAIEIADSHHPSAVITEITLPSHSGTEFIYEFRTYKDWLKVPIIIFSSINLGRPVIESHDWKLLSIHAYFQKSKHSVRHVIESTVEAINETD